MKSHQASPLEILSRINDKLIDQPKHSNGEELVLNSIKKFREYLSSSEFNDNSSTIQALAREAVSEYGAREGLFVQSGLPSLGQIKAPESNQIRKERSLNFTNNQSNGRSASFINQSNPSTTISSTGISVFHPFPNQQNNYRQPKTDPQQLSSYSGQYDTIVSVSPLPRPMLQIFPSQAWQATQFPANPPSYSNFPVNPVSYNFTVATSSKAGVGFVFANPASVSLFQVPNVMVGQTPISSQRFLQMAASQHSIISPMLPHAPQPHAPLINSRQISDSSVSPLLASTLPQPPKIDNSYHLETIGVQGATQQIPLLFQGSERSVFSTSPDRHQAAKDFFTGVKEGSVKITKVEDVHFNNPRFGNQKIDNQIKISYKKDGESHEATISTKGNHLGLGDPEVEFLKKFFDQEIKKSQNSSIGSKRSSNDEENGAASFREASRGDGFLSPLTSERVDDGQERKKLKTESLSLSPNTLEERHRSRSHSMVDHLVRWSEREVEKQPQELMGAHMTRNGRTNGSNGNSGR